MKEENGLIVFECDPDKAVRDFEVDNSSLRRVLEKFAAEFLDELIKAERFCGSKIESKLEGSVKTYKGSYSFTIAIKKQ
jgi:hypothetical protein